MKDAEKLVDLIRIPCATHQDKVVKRNLLRDFASNDTPEGRADQAIPLLDTIVYN